MAFLSLREKINTFYSDNQAYLNSQYPGISIEKIRSSLLDYLSNGTLNSNLQLDCVALEGIDNKSEKFFRKLQEGMPLDYILNQTYFYKSHFFVDKRVLIPRSETEILVEHAVKFASKLGKKEIFVADVGCGSGCILLSFLMDLPSEIKAHGIGVDIDISALEVCQINSIKHKHALKNCSYQFVNGDRLKGLEGKRFDVILSNPPYIKADKDRMLVHSQVIKYEPHVALFLEDSEYNEWFKKLFFQASTLLDNDGIFLMEGHEHHLDHLSGMARQFFDRVEIISDYTQRKRFLCCQGNRES